MRRVLIAFSFGCVLVACLPALNGWYLVAVITTLLFVIVVGYRYRLSFSVWLAGFLLGSGWGVGYGLLGQAEQLPHGLEKQPLLISGYILGMPQRRAHGYRFDFQVTSFTNT